MFAEIYQDLKYHLRVGGFIIAVIFICIAIFIIVNIFSSYQSVTQTNNLGSENFLLKYLSLSEDLKFNLLHFWVWITSLFTHVSFFHLFWNMINLYWFGMIVEDLIGRKHVKFIFFLAGIIGGIFFLISANVFPWYIGSKIMAYGASSSVMGLILAATTISPNYNLRLLLIGNISIKYLALALVVLDLLFVAQNSNSGGHAAHLGGAFMGYVYILLLRSGMDFTELFKIKKKKTPVVRTFPKSNPNRKTDFKETAQNASTEYNLNRILEKIKNSGMESLSQDEKIFLDKQSRNS